jgi:hypothetical protein
LQRHLLVVSVNRLLRVDRERPTALAVRTVADLELFGRVLEEWSERRSTFAAVEFDVFELRENARSARDDSGHLDQAIQVALSEVSQRERGGKLGDSHVNLRVNSSVGGVVQENGIKGDLVEKVENGLRRVGKEPREDGPRSSQVDVGHLEGLGVDLDLACSWMRAP